MNIVIRAPYTQQDGWGRAAQDYYKSFLSTGHTIKGVPVVLSNQVGLKPDFIEEVVPPFTPDVSFQIALPPFLQRLPGKNIGMSFTETRNLARTGWIDQLRTMDEIWVATEQERLNLGIHSAKVVPMPSPLLQGEFDQDISDLMAGRKTFYFIGEYVERKNIEAVIMAYYLAFYKGEDVVLIIKSSHPGVDPAALKAHMEQELIHIQNRMRLHQFSSKYPEVIFLAERWTDQKIANLHYMADVFVMPSRGESTCRPLIDAAFHNKTIIVTENIGAVDRDLKLITVPAREVPCNAQQPPIPYLYSGWETWLDIDKIALAEFLKVAPEMIDNKEKVRAKYSYEAVGKIISNLL